MKNEQSLNLCLRCHRRLRTCVCALLKPFETESRFIILMHPKEFKKEKVGTGRFSHLLLKNSKLLVGVNFDASIELKSYLADPHYETYLLYPGEHSLALETTTLKARSQFIVIDGTWPCAKKMMTQSTILHSIPRVSFNATTESEFQIKHQPKPGCLSTVESIFFLIQQLERQGRENLQERSQVLMDVFRFTVKQQMAMAMDENLKGYRRQTTGPKRERQISKKWSSRQLLYKGEWPVQN